MAANFDGTNRRALLSGSFGLFGGPEHGPAGLVAFGQFYEGGESSKLQVVNTDGTGMRTVYTTSHDQFLCCPAISPDGSRIVFGIRNRTVFTPDEGLWAIDADGSDLTRLTSEPSDADPAFSPDGARIAFTRGFSAPSGGYSLDVFVMNADGTGAANVTNDPSRDEADPVFSPGGDMLAFTSSYDPGPPVPFDSRIDLMRPDGTGRHSLTADIAGNERDPTWANVAALPTSSSGPGGGEGGLVAGESFKAGPVSGVIRVKCGGDDSYTRLREVEELAVGCRIDARAGKVRITSAATRDGSKTQSAAFRGGIFQVRQKAARRPVTELALVGKLENCGDASASATRPRGRRLWGDGRGRFRIRGRRSAASITGTKWLVYDRCDGSTLTRVRSGRVAVRDFVRKKTLILTAGQRYVARRIR